MKITFFLPDDLPMVDVELASPPRVGDHVFFAHPQVSDTYWLVSRVQWNFEGVPKPGKPGRDAETLTLGNLSMGESFVVVHLQPDGSPPLFVDEGGDA